jgi:glycosyltransferase involved in cell wall biosynthesis
MHLALVLEQALAPIPGGTGRHSVELARALSATREEGDVVSSWTAWHRSIAAARIPVVEGPHRLPLPRRALIAAWERGWPPAINKASVVHAPTLLVPPRPKKGALVVTIHDTVPWRYPETLTPRGVAFHLKMAERAAKYADVIAVPTAAVADDLYECMDGISADRIVVCGGGVSHTLLTHPDPDLVAAVRHSLDLPSAYLLTLSTLEPRKGLDVLLEALALTPAAPPLLVVGPQGWGGVNVADHARKLGLGADRVRVLGSVRDEVLGVLLRRATALVAPSLAEGFSLPIAEAMAVGTSVLCSDDPAQVEVAGGAAVVFPRGNPHALATSLQLFLGTAWDRPRLRKIGLKRALEFDWKLVAERMWGVYRQLV